MKECHCCDKMAKLTYKSQADGLLHLCDDCFEVITSKDEPVDSWNHCLGCWESQVDDYLLYSKIVAEIKSDSL